MTITCPHCGETQKRTKLKQSFHYSTGAVFFIILGGIIGGIFWALGRETKFECGKCSGMFFSHTTVSRIFFALCVITYIAIALLIAYGFWLATR